MERKQFKLFTETKYKKRKVARFVSTKHNNHVVLKSVAPILRLNRNEIKKIIKQSQKKFGFRIRAITIMENHIHLLIGVSSRIQFANALRYLTGMIALKIKKAKLWKARVWSRIVKSGRDYGNVLVYVYMNPMKKGIWDLLDSMFFQNGLLTFTPE